MTKPFFRNDGMPRPPLNGRQVKRNAQDLQLFVATLTKDRVIPLPVGQWCNAGEFSPNTSVWLDLTVLRFPRIFTRQLPANCSVYFLEQQPRDGSDYCRHNCRRDYHGEKGVNELIHCLVLSISRSVSTLPPRRTLAPRSKAASTQHSTHPDRFRRAGGMAASSAQCR